VLQQLSQVALRGPGNPNPRKSLRQQQIEQVLGRPSDTKPSLPVLRSRRRYGITRAQFRATLRRYPSSDLRRTQEAVEHVVRVNVESRYRPRRIVREGFGSLGSSRTCARSIEGGDVTMLGAHEAVHRVVRINIKPRNHPRRVYAEAASALIGGCARARSIENCEAAVRRAQIAVEHTARVNVVSRDSPCRVDPVAVSECGAGRIERRDGAVGSAQEAVTRDCIAAVSRDLASWVDATRGGVSTKVPSPKPVPAPGASNVVIVPSGARTKPCAA